ncbi:hypothetical protein F7734_58530 [Scytonema sp. UIC 10036]|uniref:hypothetical protein n=1 Tax=Scytonema sp. UIC 10036 TaxID=2304196 RepID=UPI0012DADDEB|nr:hypothetical protein [Scytonema sp. UIC 10036]MUH01545.1 hypothetical protein [Scytonema sp. UIC 10036]
MKGDLVYGLMQLQVFDILKRRVANEALSTNTINEVCNLIMILESRIQEYTTLIGTKDGLALEQQKEIRNSIKNIGEELNGYGGTELMLACCYLVAYTNPEDGYDSYLNRIWDGIGGWAA